jgi:hypothetical protein
MRHIAVLIFAAWSCSAHAAEIVLICDDSCQRDMIAVLRNASQNLDLASSVGRIWEKLKVAPTLKPSEPVQEKPQ